MTWAEDNEDPLVEETANKHGVTLDQLRQLRTWVNEGKAVFDLLLQTQGDLKGATDFLRLLARMGIVVAMHGIDFVGTKEEFHEHVAAQLDHLMESAYRITAEATAHHGEDVGSLVGMGSLVMMMNAADRVAAAVAESGVEPDVVDVESTEGVDSWLSEDDEPREVPPL